MLDKLKGFRANLADYDPAPLARGRLVRVTGMMLEAAGCKTNLGGICRINTDGQFTEAEVVGFEGERIFMMPVGPMGRLRAGAEVIPLPDKLIGVGNAYLGRVIDANGLPLDGKGEIDADAHVSLQPEIINPLHRQPIKDILDVGIVSINSLIIVGLVGERGREVKEFIENILDAKGLARSVVIASPADDSPTMKIRAATLTTRMAEYFRDQNKHVLLLMDSLTRFAQAQRQIALAVGEPPSTKGYPPSVFAKIPDLVERAGNGREAGGSVTAFYTVLTEGDDQQDPVADSARAILDGHVVLSRRLAEAGQYPAVDIEASVSRTMPNIVKTEHYRAAQRFRQVYATYSRNADLITVGAYTAGKDQELDYAVEKFPQMREFLKQGMNEKLLLNGCVKKLEKLF
jgi:flagellum-specific ATP synthase